MLELIYHALTSHETSHPSKITSHCTPWMKSSPLPILALDNGQAVNRTDFKVSFDSSCWPTLNLEEYLENPETGWNRTAPFCTGDEDDAACCLPAEPWTTFD